MAFRKRRSDYGGTHRKRTSSSSYSTSSYGYGADSRKTLVTEKAISRTCMTTGARVVKWDRLSEMIHDLSRSPSGMSFSSYFHGASNWKGVIEHVYEGDLPAVNEARALMQKIDTHRESEQHTWIPNVAGAFPIVAEMLAGEPECMRYREVEYTEQAPVRLFIGVTVSGGISTDILRKRGLAVLALALRLSETRAVELWAYGDGRPSSMPCLFMLRIDLASDLSQCAAILSSEHFSRGMGFEAYAQMSGISGSNGVQWGFGGNPMGTDYNDRLKVALGYTANDVLVRGGYLEEVSAIARDPVKWVNMMVEQINGEASERQ